MEWYYSFNGQQTGPVADPELEQLVAAGVILPDTLVWHEGMAEWKPYRLAAPVGVPSFAAPSAGPPGFPAAWPANQRFCSECGKSYPAGDLLQYGQSSVCGSCKDPFLRRMGGGLPAAAPIHYGGFWIRVVAAFIDGLILGALGIIIHLSLGMSSRNIPDDMPNFGPSLFAMVGLASSINILFAIIYQAFFLSKFGATPGKMALGLRVIKEDGGPISIGRAIGRYCCYWIDALPLMFGFIMAGFDSQKRALHDYICSTRVIYTS